MLRNYFAKRREKRETKRQTERERVVGILETEIARLEVDIPRIEHVEVPNIDSFNGVNMANSSQSNPLRLILRRYYHELCNVPDKEPDKPLGTFDSRVSDAMRGFWDYKIVSDLYHEGKESMQRLLGEFGRSLTRGLQESKEGMIKSARQRIDLLNDGIEYTKRTDKPEKVLKMLRTYDQRDYSWWVHHVPGACGFGAGMHPSNPFREY